MDPQWVSSRDPRRLATSFNERNRSLKPLSQTFSSWYNTIPEEVKKRILTTKHIQRVHEQFSQVVDPFILEHTNSVYLLKHKEVLSSQDNKTSHDNDQLLFDLVVYVNNSLCAAELNARRELIRLKYREQFQICIDVFEIRISRGVYKDKHPFKYILEAHQEKKVRELSSEEITHIDQLVAQLPQGRMRDSFIRAITAQKRYSD